jgi:hypothetical protein
MSASALRVVVGVLAWAVLLPSQSSPPPIDPALRARFGFVGPVVHKIGDGIRMLRVADLDGDGATEIVVDHGLRGRLEILRWQPAAERFVAETVDTRGALRGLGVGDVDADGVPDLWMLSQRGGVVVLRRGQDTGALREIDVGPVTLGDALRVGDLDADGRTDAVVLTRDGVRTITRVVEGAVLSPPVGIGEDAPRAFLLADVDGDRALDLVIGTGTETASLRVQRGDGWPRASAARTSVPCARARRGERSSRASANRSASCCASTCGRAPSRRGSRRSCSATPAA